MEKMKDLIERQKAIDAAIEAADEWDGGHNVQRAHMIEDAVKTLPSAQPESEERKAESAQNVPKEDLISRKEAIEAVRKCSVKEVTPAFMLVDKAEVMTELMMLPSAQPEIVRCKDCKYRRGLSGCYCDIVEKMVGVDSFCSWGERRTDGRD